MALERKELQKCGGSHLLFIGALLSCVETTQAEKQPPKRIKKREPCFFSEPGIVANACHLSTKEAEVSSKPPWLLGNKILCQTKNVCVTSNQIGKSLVSHRTSGRVLRSNCLNGGRMQPSTEEFFYPPSQVPKQVWEESDCFQVT